MTKATEIKTKIADTLQSLKRQEILGEVLIREVNEGIFDLDIAKYPVAVLPPPESVEGDYLTNAENFRVYTYAITIIAKNENLTPENPIEDLMETILDTFDNLPSLEGIADGGLKPSVNSEGTYTARGKTYTIFRVILKATASKAITL